MTDLANTYGYASDMEGFSIADANEVWYMELIGKGEHGKGDQLHETALRRILVDLGLRPDEDVRDAAAVDTLLDELGRPGGVGTSAPEGGLQISADAFCELMRTQVRAVL